MVISGISNAASLITSSPDKTNNKIIDLKNILTDDDKRIVKAATGHDIGQGNAVPQLADAIAISRSLGNLQGPITASFLQKYASDPKIGSTTINKALDFLRDEAFPKRHTNNSTLNLLT